MEWILESHWETSHYGKTIGDIRMLGRGWDIVQTSSWDWISWKSAGYRADESELELDKCVKESYISKMGY